MSVRAPCRVGLLGLGQMGRNHLRVLSLLRDVDLVFVHDRDLDHARALAATNGTRVLDVPLEQALEAVDALVICTPTSTHLDYLRRAIGRVGHVLVEKPLGGSVAGAEALVPLARDAGTCVQVGFIERFNPAVLALKTVLGAGEQVISIDFTRTNRLGVRIRDVDVVMDLMVHDIDLALHLNGPVTTLDAHGVCRDGVIDFASVQLRHAAGNLSRLQASRITERKIRAIHATCADRYVECDLLRNEILLHRQSEVRQGDADAYCVTSQSESVQVSQQEALLSELQAFIAAARGAPGSGLPGMDDAIATLRVAEQIQRTILTGAA